MYYLNSDGTPDTTQQSTEAFCQCDQCRRKRKRKPCYNWFSLTNIVIFVIIIGILISLTCKDTKFMNDIYTSTASYNPFSSSSSQPPQPSSGKIASSSPATINVADEFADALF